MKISVLKSENGSVTSLNGYDIGDRVLMGDDLKGIVSGLTIHRDGTLTYGVSWFHNGQRYTDQFYTEDLRKDE